MTQVTLKLITQNCPNTFIQLHYRAVTNIHLCRNFEQLIPDAPELIQSFLEGEQDPSCKRNAFMMLIHVDRVRHGTWSHDGHVIIDYRIVHWII